MILPPGNVSRKTFCAKSSYPPNVVVERRCREHNEDLHVLTDYSRTSPQTILVLKSLWVAILLGIRTHEEEEVVVEEEEDQVDRRQNHIVTPVHGAYMAVDGMGEVVAENCCRCEAEAAYDDNGRHMWV
jgi:hypothetical protein